MVGAFLRGNCQTAGTFPVSGKVEMAYTRIGKTNIMNENNLY